MKARLNRETNWAIAALLGFGLAWAQPAGAQPNPLDSLWRQAESSTDTLRVDALISLSRALRATDLAKGLQLAEQAFEQAVAIGDPARQAKAANDVGISHAMREDYAEALVHFRKAFQLHQALGNRVGVANAHSNIGSIYKHLGDYVGSREAYMQALSLQDSMGNARGRASALYNLGVVYDMIGEKEQALEVFQTALGIWEAEGEAAERANVLHAMGLVQVGQEAYDEALALLFEAHEIQQGLGLEAVAPNALNSIGMAYVKQGRYEAAVPYLLQSQEKALALGLKTPLAHSYYNLADIHLRQNQAHLAIPLLELQLGIALELNSLVLQKQGHALMAAAQAEQGNYEQAYAQLKWAEALKDSSFSEEKTRSLQQWQARLEAYEKDRQLGEQQQQLEWLALRARADRRLRWALIAALALAGFSALLFFQKYQIRQKSARALQRKNSLIEAQKTEIEAVNRELESRMLRAQINPHFIFNALGSIQHFITAGDRASALKYLSKFSSLLRQVLEDSVSANVTLAEDIKLLKIYLDLEALRFDADFEYDISLAPGLDAHIVEVPVLLVQPFVENAILHGLMPKPGDRRLSIAFTEEEEAIICRVTDNGIGREAAQQLRASQRGSVPSRGLEVSKKRLQAMDKGRGLKTPVFINDRYHADGQAAGTEVVIKIPKL